MGPPSPADPASAGFIEVLADAVNRCRAKRLTYHAPIADETLIRGALLIDADGREQSDLLLSSDGLIAARGTPSGLHPDTEIVDAAGLVALPGGIDPLMQIAAAAGPRTPADDFASGTVSAAHGGATLVVALAPDTGESPAESLASVSARADGKALVDWTCLLARRTAPPGTAAALARLRDAPGFAGVAVDLDADDGPCDIPAVLDAAARADIPVVVRIAGRLGPRAEERRLAHLAALAAMADARIHVIGVAAATAAADGYLVSADASLVALVATPSPSLAGLPPLPSDFDRDELWRALAEGRLQAVASDHRPPPLTSGDGHRGVASAELRTVLLHDAGVVPGRIQLEQLAAITSTQTAIRLGLYPSRGSLQVGAEADVVLLDPQAELVTTRRFFQGRGGAPAFEERELRGAIRHVFARGTRVVADGDVRFRPGRGRPVAAFG